MPKTKTSFKKGNTPKNAFTSDNQPPPEAKADGWAKRKLLKDIAAEVISGEAAEVIKDLAKYFGLDPEALDVETVMHLRQIEKAVKVGDTKAYNAVMDRIKGKAVQQITMNDGEIKPVRYTVIKKESK